MSEHLYTIQEGFKSVGFLVIRGVQLIEDSVV